MLWLEAEGLVERGEYRRRSSPKPASSVREKVVRKHRIIERFLTDFMGYTPEESHVQADELGDTFTDAGSNASTSGSATRIAACTVGLDTAVEHAENQELVSLSGLERGQRDRQARRARRAPHWFASTRASSPARLSTSALSMATPGAMAVTVDGVERSVG